MVRHPYHPLRYVLSALTVFGLLFIAGGLSGWWVAAGNEQAIGEISRWCERVSNGILREPVNALSNLGFIVAGLLILRRLALDTVEGRPHVNRFVGNQPIALLYGSAVVFLGAGSMTMHGSHTFIGAWFDNVSMVSYILILWIFNLSLLGRWREKTFFVVYSIVLAAYAIGYWTIGSDLGIGLELFDISIVLWVISEVLYRFWSRALRPFSGFVGIAVAAVFGVTPLVMLDDPWSHWWVVLLWVPALFATSPPTTQRTYTPWYWAGTVSFLLAYIIWTTGTDTHPLCDPDSLLQAHALWHLLTALATWCFFMFLRTEEIGDGSQFR